MKTLIQNACVCYREETVKKDVLFNEEEILAVEDHLDDADVIIDGSGLTVLPGLVDVHVHFREPSRPDKETIHTGSLAAAHGGFTSVFAMPNVVPYPDNAATMKDYLSYIHEQSVVHTYPYGTITKEEAGKEISDLSGMKKLGIRWFSDDGVGMNTSSLMKQALLFSREQNCIIACHTEDMRYRLPGASVHDSLVNKEKGWIGIPSACESEPLSKDLKIAVETKGNYHACHISALESVEALRQAKQYSDFISAEVTAHHLLLEDKDVEGTNHKMNPPLRSHADRMALIEGLENGTLDFIASDHAPHTLADKAKPMSQAAFGIVSLETSFPLLYTEFVYRKKRWTLGQLVNWMSYLPAKRFGLEKTGRIEVGYHSDLVLVRLGEETHIDKEKFYSKGKNTPFDGWSVNAKVVQTFVNGTSVYKEDE